jgi:hypothetical protein
MNHTRTRARLVFAALIGVAVALAALAGCKSSGAAAGSGGSPSVAAAASSARAAERAEATSSGGQAVKKTATQIADACKPARGWQAMYPGVPGARGARKAFIACEKIPRGQAFAWGLCIGKGYAHAPKGGPAGTPPENARQTFLAKAIGSCTKTARGAA